MQVSDIQEVVIRISVQQTLIEKMISRGESNQVVRNHFRHHLSSFVILSKTLYILSVIFFSLYLLLCTQKIYEFWIYAPIIFFLEQYFHRQITEIQVRQLHHALYIMVIAQYKIIFTFEIITAIIEKLIKIISILVSLIIRDPSKHLLQIANGMFANSASFTKYTNRMQFCQFKYYSP